MDTSIRKLLCKAETFGDGDKNQALKQAYSKLQNVAETKPDTPETLGQDLFVLCAELAYKKGHPEIAKECLRMFFMKQQPVTQFVCRAYLCQAQLLLHASADSIEQLEKAVVNILKAISIAKQIERYHFLVYNASVIYWQMCRPFLKPGYRQHLSHSLHQVVKALDDTDDSDHEWRAQLMIALIECYLDGHYRNDASQVANIAAAFIRTKVPALYNKIFGLMVEHQLGDTQQLLKESQSSPELTVFYKICKLKNEINPPDLLEAKVILPETASGPLSESATVLSPETLQQDQYITNDSDIYPPHVPEGQMKDFSKDILSILALLGISSKKTQSQSVTTYPLSLKSSREAGKPADVSEADEIPINKSERSLLLLEVCQLCLGLNLCQEALTCVETIKQCDIKDSSFHLQLTFIECQLMICNLGDKQESYQKSVVDVRLQAIKLCEEAVRNAVRQGDHKLIQMGCVTLWNLCLPLLQQNLRHFVRKPLTMITDSLESIESLLVQLRCEAHIELACCLEDQEQVQVAINNLKKAFVLDVKNVYRERLEVLLRRLELRSQLYMQPARPEDHAAMIIEQARKADSGTIRMKRAVLVKAGDILAPDAFLVVLDSENDAKEHSESFTKNLAGKVSHFISCVSKAQGHLERLGDESCRERARLWADLARTARKQEVWDVCRAACQFCLLYDNSFWQDRSDGIKKNVSELQMFEEFEDKSVFRSEQQVSAVETTQLYDRDLTRMMGEISFIYGEALVHFLRSENVQLNNKPVPPESQAKIYKSINGTSINQDEDWITYCTWIKDLSDLATHSFLHGMMLGLKLSEAWMVHNAATYIWNYNNHLLSQNRHSEIVPHLGTILEGLKCVGYAGETVMLVNICNALAQGLIKPWLDDLKTQEKTKNETVSPKITKAKGVKIPVQTKSKSPINSGSSEILSEVKKAVEVCEFAMQETNGDNPNNSVPISHRLPLLQTWVQAKQLAKQQISRHFGSDSQINSESPSQMTRSVVALEMFVLNRNGLMEFKDVPNLEEIVAMVEFAKWTDKFVELTLWARLTFLAFESHTHTLVMQCGSKALRFSAFGTQPRNRKMDLHQYSKEQELLSNVSVLCGRSLMETTPDRDSVRSSALTAFLDSAKFARSAGNYELVMAAARHFWNTSLPWVSQLNKRGLLREALRIMLECIAATTDTAKKQKTPNPTASKDKIDVQESVKTVEEMKDKKGEKELKTVEKKSSEVVRISRDTTSGVEDDLKLRAAMYGVLFQAYADEGRWTEALEAIDKAVSELPRTNHKLLIFKHRIMVKATLGQSIHNDIQRFKEETEDVLAEMWHRVALIAQTEAHQLACYQSAIEALENESSGYQKAEYLLELGQWLYANQFSLEDVQDQIGWAIDILLNIRSVDSQVLLVQEQAANQNTDPVKDSGGHKRGPTPGQQSQRKSSAADGGKKSVHRDSLKSTVSSHTSVHSKVVQSKASAAGSLMEVRARTSIGLDPDVEINPGDYIPIVKVADIGVLPVNLELTIDDLMEVRQLDALIRSHVLLAEIHDRESDQYRDILLMAQQFVMRLWKVLVSTFGPRMKEIGKVGVKEEGAVKPAAAVAGGKKDDKKEDKKKEDKQVRPKRKYPVDVLPSDVETWAIYEWPEEGIEAFRTETLRHVAINQDNITKPMLTFYYLERLVSQLRNVGYHHLALPVLAFQDLMARSVLKSNALVMLLHLRSFEVCQELNIKAGISYHLKSAGPMYINVEDRAKSRIEIMQWQEKQTSNKGETCDLKSSKDWAKSFSTDILSGVSLRVIWTDTAEVLIRQRLYPRANEFLCEANIGAEAFGDQKLQSRIMLLFARLAYYEAQYDLAITLCIKAQELKQGDEQFWFDTCILHAKATIKRTGADSFKKAKKILEAAVREFTQIGEAYPNKIGLAKFYCTKLEAQIIQFHFESIFQKSKDSNNPQVLSAILKGCESYEQLCEQFMKLQCYQDAVTVARKHGRILRMLAKQSLEKETRCMYYFQTLNVLRQALQMAEPIYADAVTLSPLPELKIISMPIQRMLTETHIELGEVMTDILVSQEKDRREAQLQEERRASIIQQVEEFIWETPVYEDKEKQWLDLGRIAADEAMASFTIAHSMSAGKPYLRAKSLAGLGRLLGVVADGHGPDPPTHWMVHDIEALRTQLVAEETLTKVVTEMETIQEQTESEEVEAAENSVVQQQDSVAAESEDTVTASVEVDEATLKKIARYTQEITAKKKQQEISKFFYMCASECLSQCLNISLQQHFTDLCAKASFEIFSLIGQHDPSAASMMLSLFQSCQSSLFMEQVLFKSQPDPMTSQLAALLHQRHYLLKNDIKTNRTTSPLYKDICTTLLSDWQAWKRLEITPNFQDILKEIPSNYIVIVLQHSPDKSFLYGAVLDKPKSAAMITKPKIGDKNAARARVFETASDIGQLQQILLRLNEYKQKQQTMLLKKEYQRTKAAQREKLLENMDDDLKSAFSFNPDDTNEDAILETEFSEIIEAMNNYLKPVLEPICNSIRPDKNRHMKESPWRPYYGLFFGGRLQNFIRDDSDAASSSKELSNESKDKGKSSREYLPRNECLVILADPDLMYLPLEASQHLQKLEGVNSVSRDFSLQLLCHRAQQGKQDSEQGGKTESKKKASKETSKTASKVSVMRDAKQKSKIVPLERVPQGWQVAVNTHFFRYIVDPFLDSAAVEPRDPQKEFGRILEQYEQQFTARWLGIQGSDHTPSVGEWEIYMTESSAFIFYGMERLLGYIPPYKISTLNMPDCNILLSFDQAETQKSFNRQCKLDTLKSSIDLSLESPIETAILTSLSGVRCILLNQWNCSLEENANRIHQTMTFLLQKGKTTGQTSYCLQNPHKVLLVEKLTQNMTAKPKDLAANKDKKKNKGELTTPKDKPMAKDNENIKADEQNKPQDDELVNEEPTQESGTAISRSVFNMVCFGMPNLIVTQDASSNYKPKK